MIWGYARGNESYFAVYEFINFIYLLLVFPISMVITDPKKYNTIFNIIIAAGVVLSIQYILNGIVFASDARFTSFHASFFPVIVALLVSRFIYLKGESIKRLGIIVLMCLFTAGAFGTLTRSVWISMIIALLATVGFYYYDKNLERLKKYTNFIMLGAAVVTVFFLYTYALGSIETAQKKGLDYAEKGSDRLESLSSQTSDASFMMRVEIAYYLYEKFMASPVIGEGLGSSVGYKVFGDSELYYPDSVWFYYLWKGGFLFFLISIWLYVRFFKTAIKIYRLSDDTLVKLYMLAFIGGFTAMMFYGLFAPQMVKYSKLNLIFAVIYAFVLAEEKKLNE
jgi:general stress protein CsbA